MRHPAGDLYRAALNDSDPLRIAISWAAAVLATAVAGAGPYGPCAATLSLLVNECGRYCAGSACRLNAKHVASDIFFARSGPALWTFAWASVCTTAWLATDAAWLEWLAVALAATVAVDAVPWRLGEARSGMARIRELLDGAEPSLRQQLIGAYFAYLDALRRDDGTAAGEQLRHMLDICSAGDIPPAIALEIAYYQASYRNKPESSRSWIRHAVATGAPPPLLLHRAVAATRLADGDPEGALPHTKSLRELATRADDAALAALEHDLAAGIEAGAAVLLDLQHPQNKWLMAG